MDIFINGVYLETDQPPFDFSFTPAELNNLQAENDLKIISYDSVFNKSETDSIFKVQQWTWGFFLHLEEEPPSFIWYVWEFFCPEILLILKKFGLAS